MNESHSKRPKAAHAKGRNNSEPRRYRDAKGHERSGSRGRGEQRKGYSANAPSQRRRQTTPSRLVAFKAWQEVSENGAYANLVFPKLLREHRISGQDAAFATELFYGSLRAKGRLDAVIARCVDRSLDKIDEKILNICRLGTYQMLDMNTPAHAAASETVGLARDVAGAGPATLVNAVMRRVSEKDRAQWLALITPADASLDEQLSVIYSHPLWIVRALKDALKAHGRDPNELEALLKAHNEPPEVDLVLRPGLADLTELLADGAKAARFSLFGAAWPSGDPGKVKAVAEGRAAVQDEGSQLVALALALGADPLVSAEAEEWLDLCAGPGGKTALLAGLSVPKEASVLAVEVMPHRSQLVQKSVQSLVDAGARVEVLTADGTTIGKKFADTFTRTLADVPCSGLGALRRRPEARWRKTAGDIGQLGKLQRDLLHSAIEATKAGGMIAYVTCSPHIAETLLVVNEVVKNRLDVEILDAKPAIRACLHPEADKLELADSNFVQLWPHVHGTDAMFLALLKKTGG